MTTKRALLFALAALIFGCGTQQGTRRDQTSNITLGEMADSGVDFTDAYEVVRYFRPGWLVKRGTARIQTQSSTQMYDFVAVYEDRTFLGDPQTLRQINAQRIGEIERLTPTQTKLLSPFFHPHGAIVVHSRVR